MLKYEAWLALKPKREYIEAALHSLGVPLTGWTNEEPTFPPGYKPNWDEIENIATAVHAKEPREWPPYIKKTAKVVEKERAPKKVARAVKKK